MRLSALALRVLKTVSPEQRKGVGDKIAALSLKHYKMVEDHTRAIVRDTPGIAVEDASHVAYYQVKLWIR